MLFIKIILIAVFLLIFYQDIKDRQVYWFLFPIVAILTGILSYMNIYQDFLLINITINILFVTFLISVVFLYSKYKLKAKLKDTFGLGDVLLFVALAFTFASVSFIILFIFGLVFSLLLHLLLKHKSKLKTVPLAGYLSIFFSAAYVSHWLGFLPTLYIL